MPKISFSWKFSFLDHTLVVLATLLYTSMLTQDPCLYPAPGSGSSNRPTTVVSSATSLAWIKNPRNVGADDVDSRTTAKGSCIITFEP